MPAPIAAPSLWKGARIRSLDRRTSATREPRRVRLGVGTQLSLGFVAVAVLALMANVLLQGGNTAVRTRIERIEPGQAASLDTPLPAAATASGNAPADTPTSGAAPSGDLPATEGRPVIASARSTESASRARARLARAAQAPSPEALVATLAEFDRRILAGLPGGASAATAPASRTRLETIPATDDEVRSALDAATQRFMRDAAQAGAPAETLRQQRGLLISHQAAGVALQASAVRRSAQLAEFLRSVEALESQLRQSLDRSLKLFGRTFASDSVIAVNQGVDVIRQAAAEINGPSPLEPAATARLAAAERDFESLLADHEASLARSQGEPWTAGIRARFAALSAAREALLQTDVAHAATLAHFVGDAPSITEAIRALARRLARQQAAASVAAARAAARAEAEAGRTAEAEAAARARCVGCGRGGPAGCQRRCRVAAAAGRQTSGSYRHREDHDGVRLVGVAAVGDRRGAAAAAADDYRHHTRRHRAPCAG